jgi:hypothetical protein
MFVHFLSRALDRVFLGIEEVFHEHDELDLAPLIYAVPGTILRRAEKPKLALPVPEHVRLETGELAYLADREKLLDGIRRGAGWWA